jgi:hypothetical protein
MRYEVQLYETPAGFSPLISFLEGLRESDAADHAAVMAGLDKLRDPHNHHEPLCEKLGDGLFQLRRAGKLGTWVLWLFLAGTSVVVVHGVKLEGQAILDEDLKVARERRSDWMWRHQA